MAQNNCGDESDAMIDDTIENRNEFDNWLRESLFTADDRFRQKSAVIGTIFFEFVCTLFRTMAENDCDVEVNAKIDDAIPNLNDFDDSGSDVTMPRPNLSIYL